MCLAAVGWRSGSLAAMHSPNALRQCILARAGLRTRFAFYNQKSPHAALDGQRPDVVCRPGVTIMQPDQEARRVA